MQNYMAISECLERAADKSKDIFVYRLKRFRDYIMSEAWKHTVAEFTGAWTVYGEL